MAEEKAPPGEETEDDQLSLQRRLVILDLNGVLCRKLSPEETREKVKAYKNSGGGGHHHHNHCVKLPKSAAGVEFRPGYDAFITELLTKYQVAVFSSTMEKNCRAILDFIPGADRFEFYFFRDHTRWDPETPETSYDTIKLLRDIYENPIANPRRIWSECNTIIIDDSATKLPSIVQKMFLS